MYSVVIGGQGFIGGAIVRALLDKGADVLIADVKADPRVCEELFQSDRVRTVPANVLNLDDMRRVTSGAESVFHLAGMLGTSELDSDIVSGVQVNVLGSVNVFSACVDNRVPTVFNASKPNVWLNTYSITKYAAEQFARLYDANSDTRFCSLRYFNAFGPHQSSSPVRKVIPSFAERAMRGLPIEVFGDGEQIVDMVFSADIGRITVEFARVASDPQPLDCGRGIPLSINQIAAAVNAFYGNKAGVTHLPMRQGETPGTRLVADTSQLLEQLSDLRFTEWDASLATTLEWYAENVGTKLGVSA